MTVLESRVEKRLTEGVRSLGGKAIKMVPTVAGIPDRLVLLPGGRVFFVELKSPAGKLRRVQEVWLGRLDRLGMNTVVLGSTEEVDRWLKEIRK